MVLHVMAFVIGILIIVIMILIIYLIFIRTQLRNMSRQLDKRLLEHTRQPISLEMINKDLNQLVAKINQCFKAEETLRLNGIREEKKFKEMIADISHDLRTPLTAITGYQQLINSGELNEDQRKKLNIAMKHAKELGQLIEHFFEYSYLVNTEPELQIEYFNLTKLLTECLVAAITTLEEHNLKVCFEEAPVIYLSADKQKVTRIIQNLIRNCIQHSEGDIMVKVIGGKDTMIVFANPVKNADELDVNRIFDRFYTGDKARRHSTGLGLAIIKLLTEQMGGRTGALLQDGLLEIKVTFPGVE